MSDLRFVDGNFIFYREELFFCFKFNSKDVSPPVNSICGHTIYIDIYIHLEMNHLPGVF